MTTQNIAMFAIGALLGTLATDTFIAIKAGNTPQALMRFALTAAALFDFVYILGSG